MVACNMCTYVCIYVYFTYSYYIFYTCIKLRSLRRAYWLALDGCHIYVCMYNINEYRSNSMCMNRTSVSTASVLAAFRWLPRTPKRLIAFSRRCVCVSVLQRVLVCVYCSVCRLPRRPRKLIAFSRRCMCGTCACICVAVCFNLCILHCMLQLRLSGRINVFSRRCAVLCFCVCACVCVALCVSLCMLHRVYVPNDAEEASVCLLHVVYLAVCVAVCVVCQKRRGGWSPSLCVKALCYVSSKEP